MKHQEIVERTRALAARPARPPNAEKAAAVMKAFTDRTTGSARLFQQAGQVLPRGCEHAWTPSVPYPLFMDHGRGSRVWDVDGNEYVDYILAGGPLILGHNPEGLRRSMIDLIAKRTWFHGFSDEMEVKAAEKIIRHFPAIERVRFTSSGTEANAAAARIARSYTGKKKVIKFLAGYHGWSDQFLTDMEVPGSGRYVSQGVPDEVLDLTVLVPPNELEALDRALSEHAADGGVAAVFAEPVGGESGLVPFADGFHASAIELAHRHGALYVFDEVVTGLRMGLGGAQEALGVKPDLTTLGKALMGGWPSCGAVGGSAEVMQTATVGVIPDGKPFAYFAGTLAGQYAFRGGRVLHDPGAGEAGRHGPDVHRGLRPGGQAQRLVRLARLRFLFLQLRRDHSHGDDRRARRAAHRPRGLPGGAVPPRPPGAVLGHRARPRRAHAQRPGHGVLGPYHEGQRPRREGVLRAHRPVGLRGAIIMRDSVKRTSKGTALVTGASRGIGKAIAAALAADGWEVTGTSRSPKKLTAEDRVPGVRYLPLDFSRKASVEALARKARGCDLLVNNAGASSIGPAEEAPPDKVRALFESNFFGAVRLTQAVLPAMRVKRTGTIVFIGSMAGEAPRAFSAFYAASKAAIKLFAECLRMEVNAYGIHVAVVAPYFISTTIKQEEQGKKDSPYAAAVQRVKQVRDRILMSGQGPEVVAERLMDVLGKKSPPAFTAVGRHARLQAFFIRHLPRRMVEWLSARRFKL